MMDNEVNRLNRAIEELRKIPEANWLTSLSDRKIKELEFHDRDRSGGFVDETISNDTYEQFYGNRKYYSVTARSKNFVKQWIEEESQGRIFLDYACGNGSNALLAAKSGAVLSLGLDISPVSIENAKAIALIEPGTVGPLEYFQADAENTRLPDNSVDRIICSGMLHHLDLSYAIPELRRILKPGGKILAGEALDYNPLIKIYRKMTPDMRTEWEKAHILSLQDVHFISKFFEIEQIKYWHILGIVAGKWPKLLPVLDRVDKFL